MHLLKEVLAELHCFVVDLVERARRQMVANPIGELLEDLRESIVHPGCNRVEPSPVDALDPLADGDRCMPRMSRQDRHQVAAAARAPPFGAHELRDVVDHLLRVVCIGRVVLVLHFRRDSAVIVKQVDKAILLCPTRHRTENVLVKTADCTRDRLRQRPRAVQTIEIAHIRSKDASLREQRERVAHILLKSGRDLAVGLFDSSDQRSDGCIKISVAEEREPSAAWALGGGGG